MSDIYLSNIPIIRDSSQRSQKKLRRARRLYGQIIYREALRNPEILYICAQRAISRGLYSPKTGYRDVVFGLCRHVFRVYKTKHGRENWRYWVEKISHLDWNSMGHKKRLKYGKPVVRLVA